MLPKYIFSGYDDRQSFGYDVFAHSVWRHSHGLVDTIALKHKTLRDKGLFNRPWKIDEKGQFVDLIDGKPFSTQFSHTRFLVPAIAKKLGLKGTVLFVDGNDFLCLQNPYDIFFAPDLQETDKPVYVVKHNYNISSTTKMDGMINEQYPKKNWSSCMLFNLDHPALDKLIPAYVNNADGSVLHQFKWLESDELIGTLDPKYNVLIGEDISAERVVNNPVFLHYTKGLPLMKGYEESPYAWLWRNEEKATMDWKPTPSINLEKAL